ncbi:MAG: SDR family NAD(P)-dependent oxidoreductase [Nitrososphaerales archaeon]
MGKFDGKVAVVTGGASGIGLASATLLAGEGAEIVVVDRDGPGAQRAAEGIGAKAVTADVSKPADWKTIVDAAHGLGGVDFAHLNAGVTTGQADLASMEDSEYRRIMSVNVDGVVFGIRALLPELTARGGGTIVVTASLAGLIAFPADPIYTMTKHAMVGLVRSLGPALGERNITINAICPGLVDTPLINGDVRDAIIGTGFPLIAPVSVAEAVLEAALSGESGQAWVVQAGREPVAYRFGRPPGPRSPGAEGKVPPGWLADQAHRSGRAVT